MRRIVAVSVVFGLGLLALSATGQPPAGGGNKPADKKAEKAAVQQAADKQRQECRCHRQRAAP